MYSLLLTLAMFGQPPAPDFNMTVPQPPIISQDTFVPPKPIPLYDKEDKASHFIPEDPNRNHTFNVDIVLDKKSNSKIIYMYLARDKFGHRWKSESEAELEKKISEENKKDWTIKDKHGVLWSNPNLNDLKKDVDKINNPPVQKPTSIEEWPRQVYYTVPTSQSFTPIQGDCSNGRCRVR